MKKYNYIPLYSFSRFIKKNINRIRVILNYGAKASRNILNDVIRTHFSMLPQVQDNELQNLFPQIQLGVDTDFNTVEVSFNLLKRVCDLSKELGFERVTIFFDKMDEDNRLHNDADDIALFISPLLTDNKLLLAPWIQLVVFVWEIPFNKLSSNVRTQKLTCVNIQWEFNDLVKALNRRICFFSDDKVNNYEMLFSDDVTPEDKLLIFSLSNRNPRDLWHIFNKIIEMQYKINANVCSIGRDAVVAGCIDFVKKFNFLRVLSQKKQCTCKFNGYIFLY